MRKDILKVIKEGLRECRRNKQYFQRAVKQRVKEIEAERKEDLAELTSLPEDDWYRQMRYRDRNKYYDRLICKEVYEVCKMFHNDESYYLIYRDGSEVVITAEEILNGEPFPKLSNIVYAEMSSADDHMDTERGDLDWYSDAAMEVCDYDYDAEDERKWQYETAIQFKFGTAWSTRFAQGHPEFVPVVL